MKFQYDVVRAGLRRTSEEVILSAGEHEVGSCSAGATEAEAVWCETAARCF